MTANADPETSTTARPPSGDAERMADERFTGLGRLIAGTAYELEPPLSKVVANLGAALEGLSQGEIGDCADLLLAALDAAKRARDTVSGLKAFTTSEEDVPAELDVHEALELALELTRGVVRQRAVLVRQYVQVPRVAGSLARLAHVFVACCETRPIRSLRGCVTRTRSRSAPPSRPDRSRSRSRTPAWASSRGIFRTSSNRSSRPGVAPRARRTRSPPRGRRFSTWAARSRSTASRSAAAASS